MLTSMDLIGLARHMEWADAIVWEAVVRSEAGRSDKRILTWLYHIHTVQHAFVSIWRGEQPQFRDPAELSDPRSFTAWAREGHSELQAFLAGATAETLAREIQIPWAAEIEQTRDRQLKSPTLEQTALQVALHSTHHRGQVNARLREVGGEPPITDFIAWVWWGQPTAAWPLLGPAGSL